MVDYKKQLHMHLLHFPVSLYRTHIKQLALEPAISRE